MVDLSSNGWRWGAGGLFGCVALGVVAMGLGMQSPETPAQVAPEKVSLAGVPVAGKTREEVQKIAEELSRRVKAYPLAIRSGKRTERTHAAGLGAAVDIKRAVDAVFDPPGAPPNLLERILERVTGPEARDVPLTVQVTEEGVRKGLLRFSIRIGAEPKNARLTKVGGQFKSQPPEAGKELDSPAVARVVQAAVDAPELRARVAASLAEAGTRAEWVNAQSPVEIPAVLREAQARITLEHLKPIAGTLSTFSTGLGRSSRNRVHNVSLACKAVDGTVLLPGDTFSYNDVVGPRVPSAGYREAPVIIRGELQPGTGGGICQVSSTLYNAVLLADMEIVRRRHHAFPVHYLPAGRDATVVDGSIDFRFKNRLDYPVAIDAKVVRGRVVMHLYGHPDDEREVTITTSRVSRVPAGVQTVSDPRLPKGKRVVEKTARDGRRVTVSRTVKKEGEVVREEVVSRDYYRAFPGVIRIGTAEVPKPDAEAKPSTVSESPSPDRKQPRRSSRPSRSPASG
jgi:vancomycin resistance protein YoaR